MCSVIEKVSLLKNNIPPTPVIPPSALQIKKYFENQKNNIFIFNALTGSIEMIVSVTDTCSNKIRIQVWKNAERIIRFSVCS